MQRYGLSEVEKLLQLPRSTIRSLIKSGFVSPARGLRGALQFSFQDLVVLRKAAALAAAKVPTRRIARAMKELRRRAESGQYALAFEPAPAVPKAIGQKAAPPEHREALAPQRDEPLLQYNLGVQLEDLGRRQEALAAYQAALRGDPAFADCHYNLGLLYESLGRKKDAIRHLAHYRRLTRRRPK